MENSNQYNRPEEMGNPAYAKASADERDPKVWEMAQRRVSFKNHLAVYIIVNIFLWGIWYFYTDNNGGYWPIYSTFGWGIGLAFHFMGAYVFPKENSVEREYDKMMRNKK
jgi:hypothetical protein